MIERLDNAAHAIDTASPRSSAKRTVLITGGTDGLGRAMAAHYLAVGWHVIVVGRTRRAVDEATFLAADLAAPAAHLEIARALDVLGVATLDLLVLNAAMGIVGAIEQGESTAIERLIATNVWSPIGLTHTLLPRLRGAHAQVVFIGSVAAFVAAPRYAAYAASKAALDGFVRSIAPELAGEVRVQVIHPGPIRTAFHARAGATDLASKGFPSAEHVAAQVVRAIDHGGWRRFVDMRARALGTAGSVLRAPFDAMSRVRARRDARALDQHDSVAHDLPPALPRRAVVTGASSGLGAALVHLLLSRGDHVVGVDRSAQPPSGLAVNHRYAHVVCDFAKTGDVARLPGQLGSDALLTSVFHCAGTSAVGAFATKPLEPLRAVLWANFVAPLLLTTRLLNEGRFAHDARVVFVSSLSHYVGYPGAAVYAASKDGLAHFGRCLSVAPLARRIRTLIVFPGPMRTPHAEQFAPAGSSAAHRVAPETVAAAILRAADRGDARLVVGRGARLARMLGVLAPTMTTRLMRRTLYQRLIAGVRNV